MNKPWNWSLVTLIRVIAIGEEPGLTGARKIIRQEKAQSISITCGFSSCELGPIVPMGMCG